ncbi:beta-ketoacyl reductase, partial [Phenylobacterium sp.]
GLVVARWLAEHGARHIALLGRRPDLGAPGVAEIEALGAKVHTVQADVADEAAMARAFEQLKRDAPPLRGVMHAAAALSAAPLLQLDDAMVRQMLAPKLAGTLVLKRLTRGMPLDFLVLFSSTTALLGASGLAHYAAANTFLDTLAEAIDASRRVISVNWGTWEVMRLASSDDQRSYREGGLQPMAAADALDALGRL